MKKPIDCYQLLSCNLFSFVILWLTNPKMTYGAFFPLSFCPWTQIFMQNSETTTNTVFWNPPSLRLHKSVVNLKIQYLFSSLHSACKFVFRDKKWVEKCPISHILDWSVKMLQIRRGCVIKVGNNLWAFSPQKYPTIYTYSLLWMLINV